MKIQTDYDQLLERIEIYLAKESGSLTEPDLTELQRLSLLVERYEDEHYPMPVEPVMR